MVFRVYVEKKPGFDVEAQQLAGELRTILGLTGLKALRIVNRYDVEGISQELFDQTVPTVFSEPQVDNVAYDLPDFAGAKVFATEFLPGQFDQRADSAAECIQLISQGERPTVRSAKLYALEGELTDADVDTIKHYVINPVEAREASLETKETLKTQVPVPGKVETIAGFNEMDAEAGQKFIDERGLAMDLADLEFCQKYFSEEGREPTITEIKVIDTYWSDHCRHTTFNTELLDLENKSERFQADFDRLAKRYAELRRLNGREEKPVCLMDMATIVSRDMRRRGQADDVEVSDEINACSVHVNIDNQGKTEPWMFMFKNETHNHPTEIEPFGGAGTCLGGAIRDPLSGRAWVYQALRISGAGDINTPLDQTLPGKLPQRDISRLACKGYSSYGNQIGLAATKVRELHHPGYTAKRLELGAVAAAVPAAQLRREKPRPGDVIILVGGRTGRDGVGGATGSSKAHTTESLRRSGSEVQKGNPVTERKIQRLFRRSDIGPMIRKCNDFGAGGVAVAVGELADSLDINLDLVPLKYKDLSAFEVAISESQERMAVLIDPKDEPSFLEAAADENLEAVRLAEVTDTGRLRMFHRGKMVLDLSRDFLDQNGAPREQRVVLKDLSEEPLNTTKKSLGELRPADLKEILASPESGRQEGMVEQFDSSIGRSTVLMPYGGMLQKTEEAVSAQTFPTEDGSNTASLMTYGFRPGLADSSPYLMAAYSVIEALSRLVAAGADYDQARLSCQEYFRRLDNDEEIWGSVVQTLFGLIEAQEEFGVPAIGGKDSMSGSFESMHVPPTLVSFAAAIADSASVIPATLPNADFHLYYLPHQPLADGRPNYEQLRRNFQTFLGLAQDGGVLAASAILPGGLVATITNMALGNRCGIEIFEDEDEAILSPVGGIVFASAQKLDEVGDLVLLGESQPELDGIRWNQDCLVVFEDAELESETAYGKIFPVLGREAEEASELPDFATAVQGHERTEPALPTPEDRAEVRVLLPVFPGTNCEYDTGAAFRAAGAQTEMILIRNLTAQMAEDDRLAFMAKLENTDILAFSGGFSFGDEPDGSAKFIVNFLRSPEVRDTVLAFLERGGLMLGICNGFQALLKSGFLPYGDPTLRRDDSPTLFHNKQGHHVSRIVSTATVSTKSPWLSGFEQGEVHRVPVSHGEGRVIIDEGEARKLFEAGQVAFQYVDPQGNPTLEAPWNPNGSQYAIEGLISPNGQILGKMGHPERYRDGLMKNIPGIGEQRIFANAVRYCKERKAGVNA